MFRDGRNPNSLCSGAPQNPRTFRSRRPSRQHIVNHDNRPAFLALRPREKHHAGSRCALARQSDLRVRRALPLEHRRDFQRLRHILHRRPDDQLRLVESAFAALGLCSGTGTSRGALSPVRSSCCDRFRQQPSQDRRGRHHVSYFSRWISPRTASAYSPNETARSKSGSNSWHPRQRPSQSKVGQAAGAHHTEHTAAREWAPAKTDSPHRQAGERCLRGGDYRAAIGGEKYGEDTACYGNNWRDEGLRCSARCTRRCRSRVARLLKTTLQSMMPTTKGFRLTGGNLKSV